MDIDLYSVKYNGPMPRYHHGDLRRALIEATESLLAEKGPEAFSLREVARRAGVSPAAPAHHFADAAGLLTAVATAGFDGLAQALREGEARGGADPRQRLVEQGVGYVQFALRHPGRFRLMFRDALHADDPGLQRSGNAAFGVLEEGVRLAFGIAPGEPLTPEAWTALVGLWSVVHGYAHLTLAGRLDPCAGGRSRKRFVADTLRPVLACAVAGFLAAPPARRGSRATSKRASS
jgi:AcrR family transcriptional regulator